MKTTVCSIHEWSSGICNFLILRVSRKIKTEDLTIPAKTRVGLFGLKQQQSG